MTTLDQSQDAFRASLNSTCAGEPTATTNRAAGAYLRTLMDYHADDMIGDDTFLNGLAEIETYLREDNNEGQDRESYSDTQDRESYSVT